MFDDDEPIVLPRKVTAEEREADRRRRRLEANKRSKEKNPEKYREIGRAASERARKRNPSYASEATKKSYYKNHEVNRARAAQRKKERYAKDPTKIREQQKAWQAANPDKMKSHRLKRTHGITLAEFNARFEAQGNVCAVFGCTEPGSMHGWVVDHCHKTRAIRGILCHHCNLMLGQSKDDPARLRAGADYLERYNQ